MSATESSSSSTSKHSSPASSPEIPKKASKSTKIPPEVPKSLESPPEIPKKAPQSSQSPPEIPKKASQSSQSPPEILKKAPQSSQSPPEILKKAPQSSQSPPEIPKKASQSSQSSPEILKKAPQSSQSPPEIPKKAQQSSQSPPEIPKKAQQSSQSPPEIPKKAPQSSRSSETPKEDPISSPEIPEKITSSPSAPPTESKVSESPPSSEGPNTSPLSSPESPRDNQKSPAGESEALFKRFRGNKSFKSSLQVFLQQKHNTELQKTIEYKDKLERGEGTDEDDDIEDESKKIRRGSEDNGVDKARKERKNEGIKDDGSMKKVDKNEEEYEKGVEPTNSKIKVSDAKQTKETKEKMKENSEIEKEREKEKEESKKTAKKEKEKSAEITTQKTQEEVKTKEKEKKGFTKEERKEKSTKEETAQEEKKTKKRNQEMSTRKKEGINDERPQGHLYLKKKRTFNPWKEYYFVLDGLLLTYYRSQHDYERLSSMKGSLDLSLVEEVRAKKPGILRIHHPFCLARRNLPSIKLAAETKEEQEQWMEVLKAAVGPRRLSCYSSDKTLNSGTSPTNYLEKSATLPGRIKNVSSYSSSITEEEDDEEKKELEEKEEEKEKEEEPELIKPKKIPRMPIGMPIFKPNLEQVKLKNVERKEVKREDVEEGKAANVSPRGLRQEDPSKEASVSEVFGVVLKKAKKKEEKEEEEKVEKQEEEKESSKEAGGGRDGSASPGHATSSNRRPLKQPVIPLNNKLLVLPEVKESKSPKVSPVTQKRSTVDRRKSPSPSLPISKSVQALTKSAEEVRTTQMDTISSADTTTTVEWKGKDGEVKVYHAHTSEVKYSDVVDLLDMEEVTEELIKERKKGSDEEAREKDETSENEDKVMNESEKLKQKEGEGAKVLLDTAVKVNENEKEDEEENKGVVVAALKEEASNENTFSEESLNNYNTDSQQVVSKEKHKDGASSAEHKGRGSEVSHSDALPESSSVATSLTPPASPASSVTSSDSETVPKASLSSTSSSELIPPSPKSGPLSPKQTPPSSSDRRDVEEKVNSTTQENKQMASEKQEEEFETVASDGPRDRSNTNESTTSSSCLEGAEKKPGKFNFLKNKLKGGSMKEKKEESAVQREPKEKKRRGSNTFSSLLPGKKSKESNKKPVEEELQPSQLEDTNGSRVVSPDEVTPLSESPILDKALPVTVVPAVDVQVIPPSAPQPCEEEPQDKQDAFLSSLGSAGNGMVTLRATTTYGEARSSVHSRTSSGSRDDPPPSIPEKTYMRAPSPNHDVPKNNRPVTNLHLMAAEEECDEEDETNQRVDGYITQEQIEALLNAKENRDKRKRSLSRNQSFAKPDVVKDMPLASLSNDDWATKRPSYASFSSIDSDESLLTTNFLSFERQSSSSSSIKGLSKAEANDCSSCSFSESGDSHRSDVEAPAESLWRAPRATDAIVTKNRVSLTSPEFTVEEEELLSSPETPKLKPTRDINVEEDDTNKEQHDGNEDESEAEAECKDFFPVVGGDVQLRQPAPLDLPTGNLRTSGIVSLKEYLEAQEEKEDFQDVKSCINRLGHSAAIEKLKQTTSEQ